MKHPNDYDITKANMMQKQGSIQPHVRRKGQGRNRVQVQFNMFLLLLLQLQQLTSVTSFLSTKTIKHDRSLTKIKSLSYRHQEWNQYQRTRRRTAPLQSTNYNNHETNDDDDDDEEMEFGKFQLDDLPNTSADTTISTNVKDETQLQIEQQQKQIDMLMKMMRNQSMQQPQEQQAQPQQQSSLTSSSSSSQTKKINMNNNDDSLTLPPPLPGMFDEMKGEDELLDYTDETLSSSSSDTDINANTGTDTGTGNDTSTTYNSQQSSNSNENITAANGSGVLPLAPLKVMLFIDGTWLYYSLHRRKEDRDPIVKKFGRGWQYRYRFDWNALPRIVCEELVGQQKNLGWSATGSPESIPNNAHANNINYPTQRPMEIVRASVFTSYKKTTDPNSFRVKMYNEMANANYDLHMLESVGNGPEKCVDISLAVEMLHYATVPNAYDVAILLSGDKDFIPALVRTRQKGRKVGIVSMRTGCNRALYESPHIKDFDVVWIDDFLDQLLVPLPPDQVDSVVESVHDRGLLSAFTITKVIYDFISYSPFDKVSSRDIGRYLKGLEIKDGTTLLDDVKLGQGGLRRFLQDRMPDVFDVIDKTAAERIGRDSNDKSYWISTKRGATDIMLMEAKSASFTEEEKQFLKDYKTKLGDGDDLKEEAYYYTIESTSERFDFATSAEEDVSTAVNGNGGDGSKEHVDYSKLTVVKLKEICRERNLHVSGTKAMLIERIENDIGEEERSTSTSTSISTSNINSSGAESSLKEATSKYLEDLVKYYITQCNGSVSSRDLGRFLATNKAYKSDSISALQQLKEIFGGVASFLNQRTHLFVTVRDQEQSFRGSTNNYSFGIRLREPGDVSNESSRNFYNRQRPNIRHGSSGSAPHPRSKEVDPEISNHIESLIREYLRVRAGIASSRDIGRYLSANAAFGTPSENNGPWLGRRKTALQQLKENYGSLASYLGSRDDVFATVSGDLIDSDVEGLPPSQHAFGVTLK